MAGKKGSKKEDSKKDSIKAEVEKKVVRSHLHSLAPEGKKSVKVKGLVNMHCLDGCQLEVGKECMITEKEADRLEADARGNLIERLKK